jgi:hypothetical protein
MDPDVAKELNPIRTTCFKKATYGLHVVNFKNYQTGSIEKRIRLMDIDETTCYGWVRPVHAPPIYKVLATGSVVSIAITARDDLQAYWNNGTKRLVRGRIGRGRWKT